MDVAGKLSRGKGKKEKGRVRGGSGPLKPVLRWAFEKEQKERKKECDVSVATCEVRRVLLVMHAVVLRYRLLTSQYREYIVESR